MSNNIKYTTDGKKVVVLGNLNSQEKIVQEIFVVDGSEIPSGEHFVVKSLHDAPVVSWKEKHLKEIEDKYESTFEKKKKEFDEMVRRFESRSKIISEKISFLGKLDARLHSDDFTRLIDFISGNFKFVVMSDWGDFSIREYDDSISTRDRFGSFESIKLLSVFGQTNGDLAFKINEYCDGSGQWRTVIPCKTMDDALAVLKDQVSKYIESRGVSESLVKTCNKYQIQIPKDKMDKFVNEKRDSVLKKIKEAKELTEKYERELSSL